MKLLFRLLLALGLAPAPAPACDLCAVYNASNARGESSSGFLFTLSQQYVPYENLQREGESLSEFPFIAPAFRDFLESAFNDTAITHFVPTYNLSQRVGVSLNVPFVYRDFRRAEINPVTGQPLVEEGTESGLGDLSLVARWTAFRRSKMKYSVFVNFLAGVKFPTGDTERLEAEVAQEELYRAYSHAHAIGGVHQHDLTLGSGSYDGVFGATANLRWQRWILNAQFQYYLRTEALGYEYGDMIMVTGGPGFYVLLGESFSLSLQANAVYESMGQDTVLGQNNTQTGLTSWYLGPQLALTWGEHFSANAGVDIPLDIYNHGFRSVPDFRFHGGLNWKF